jgi:hypothetical protein
VRKAGDRAKAIEVWQRFPKFILGFVVTFVIALVLALTAPADIGARLPAAIGEANTFRVIFFLLTFFSTGVLSNFREPWAEGIGKLAAVYLISLFGFVIWVGLLISWLFFAGVKPPLASWQPHTEQEHAMSQSDLRTELHRNEVEPLLPIEKKLIGWSLGTGIFLLAALALIGRLLGV